MLLPVWLLYGLASGWLLVTFATAWIVAKRWFRKPDPLFLAVSLFLVAAGSVGTLATIAWPPSWVITSIGIAIMVFVLVHFAIPAPRSQQLLTIVTLVVSLLVGMAIPLGDLAQQVHHQQATTTRLTQFLSTQTHQLNDEVNQLAALGASLSQTAPGTDPGSLATLALSLNHTLVAERLTSLIVTDAQGSTLLRAEQPAVVGDLYLTAQPWGAQLLTHPGSLKGFDYDANHLPQAISATPFYVQGKLTGFYLIQKALDQDYLQQTSTPYSWGLADQKNVLLYQTGGQIPSWIWENTDLSQALSSQSASTIFLASQKEYATVRQTIPTLDGSPFYLIALAPTSS